jgi:hypothetical protein
MVSAQRIPAFHFLFAILCIAAWTLAPTKSAAQVTFNFNSITVNWPSIQLHFSVLCTDPFAPPLQKSNFQVVENGVVIGEFTLWCPDTVVRCPISVALVFDASNSMAGTPLASAKSAGNQFVDYLDGVKDQAAVFSFASTVTMRQAMTINKTLLHNAINAITNSGNTAVWDGVWSGLTEVNSNGTNPCKAVIVLTDGINNSGTHSLIQVINLAKQYKIPVFTIGLGNGVQSGDLTSLATQTGGRYYAAPTPAELNAIYQDIAQLLTQQLKDCIITYKAKCADGSTRTVDLTLLNYCGISSITKSLTYTAPKDTTTFTPLHIKLGRVGARGLQNFTVPIQLMDPITPADNFPASTLEVKFDAGCMQFVKVETPANSIFEGVPLTVTPITGGIRIQSANAKVVDISPSQIPALIANLVFKATDPPTMDTVCCPVTLSSWAFDKGCYKPVLESGEVCISARRPEVLCTIISQTELTWSGSSQGYTPNPFPVIMHITNFGDREATRPRFKITYDPRDVQLVSPTADTQNGSAAQLNPYESMDAQWVVYVYARTTADSIHICVTASFDNHPDVTCCIAIWVPRADALIRCSMIVPTITIDKSTGKYSPMPFDVTVTVRNEGGYPSDTLYATIVLPGDLKLAGADAPDKFRKRVVPPILQKGQQGQVQWSVWHPYTFERKDYIIGVWIHNGKGDSSYCEARLIIPPAEMPILTPTCSVPDSLHFNETTDSYEPNPFTVSLSCINKASWQATNVSATVSLPKYVVFADSTETAHKIFNPSTMDQYNGGPIPTLSWRVLYTKKLRVDTYLDFRFVVYGKGPFGVALDSIEIWCRVRVPGLKPSFQCSIAMPDSLAANAAGTDVEPNPFTITYKIWNDSKQPATITQVDLSYPLGEDITLDPSTPATRTINKTLNPKDTITLTWILHVKNRTTRRLVHFAVIAFDDENNIISGNPPCSRDLPIANLKTSLLCEARTSESLIAYSRAQQRYVPSTWTITAQFRNPSVQPVSNLTAEIELLDSAMAQYVEFDPTFSDNTNPKSMVLVLPQSSQTFQWGFRLKAPNAYTTSVVPIFNIRYKSTETPLFTSGCDVAVEIGPIAQLAKLACKLRAPDTIRFVDDRYEPSPFDVEVGITNLGNGDAINVRSYVLQDTRFVILPPSMHDHGTLSGGKMIDFNTPGNAPFQLKVTPRQNDGYDTVRVMITADELPPVICEYPIFVQHEARPAFVMNCRAIPDRLVFDEKLNDYSPNPFTIVTTAVNTGGSKAEECQLVFVGPPRFTPADNTPIVGVGSGGVVRTGDTVTHTWNVRPLKRTVGGWDTLIYQVQGRGGLGRQLVIGECRVPVYVPAARAAQYRLGCATPDSLHYDAAANLYTPDPFLLKTTIHNLGLAEGTNLEVTAILPPGCLLATGETSTKTIPILAAGDSVVVSWLVHPALGAGSAGKQLTLCVQMVDGLGTREECCTGIYVPPPIGLSMGIACATTVDSLHLDAQRSGYIDNPFVVTARVSNNSNRPLTNVRLLVVPMSTDLRVSGDPERFVAARLDPNVTTDTIAWLVTAVPRTTAGSGTIGFHLTADGLPSEQCAISVYIPAMGTPQVWCATETSMQSTGDTLRFDYGNGDFADDARTRSQTGRYNVFSITTTVHNAGTGPAYNTRAVLVLPENVSLEPGEEIEHALGDMAAGSSTSTTWVLKPFRRSEASPVPFTIQLYAGNRPVQSCTRTAVIQAAPKYATLRLPDNGFGQYPYKVTVPVLIDPTIGDDMYTYRINIQYNESMVRFVDVVAANTLTEIGWNGPRGQVFAARGSDRMNILRIQDYTTGTPLNTRHAGVLVAMIFEVIAGGPGGGMTAQSDSLVFLRAFEANDGKKYSSSVNSTDDTEGTDVRVTYVNGLMTVSGDCIVPLTAGEGYSLTQNKPNPFNPVTTIEYTIPEETDVTLTVFDQLGRLVRSLVKSHQKPGRYSVLFDGSDVASGLYVYRLETPRYSKQLRMMLAR